MYKIKVIITYTIHYYYICFVHGLAALGNFAPLMVLVTIGKGMIAATYGTCWIYLHELYPTSIRSSAGAIGYGVSRVGSMIGAYMSHLVSTDNHW